MKIILNPKNILLLAIATFIFTACSKEPEYTQKHDYELTLTTAAYLFTRQYADFAMDSARVAVLPVDSAVRFVLNHEVDTIYYKDTAHVRQV